MIIIIVSNIIISIMIYDCDYDYCYYYYLFLTPLTRLAPQLKSVPVAAFEESTDLLTSRSSSV